MSGAGLRAHDAPMSEAREEPVTMPFFIAHVSGPPSSKRVLTDPGGFETPEAAEQVAQRRWPDGDYFIVEAEDEHSAGYQAIAESRALDRAD